MYLLCSECAHTQMQVQRHSSTAQDEPKRGHEKAPGRVGHSASPAPPRCRTQFPRILVCAPVRRQSANGGTTLLLIMRPLFDCTTVF